MRSPSRQPRRGSPNSQEIANRICAVARRRCRWLPASRRWCWRSRDGFAREGDERARRFQSVNCPEEGTLAGSYRKKLESEKPGRQRSKAMGVEFVAFAVTSERDRKFTR